MSAWACGGPSLTVHIFQSLVRDSVVADQRVGQYDNLHRATAAAGIRASVLQAGAPPHAQRHRTCPLYDGSVSDCG